MTRRLIVVLGDQLTPQISSLSAADKKRDVVLMCEVWEEATYVRHQVARALVDNDDQWRDLMPEVRRVAGELVAQGRIRVTQAGKVVDAASARGPIRLSLATRKKSRSRVS